MTVGCRSEDDRLTSKESGLAVSAHTPGPWEVRPVGNADFRKPNEDGAHDLCIVAANGICPGIVWEFMKEGEANAHLIAAAPDLLALAKQYAAECLECTGTGRAPMLNAAGFSAGDVECDACADIRAVIAKAMGAA